MSDFDYLFGRDSRTSRFSPLAVQVCSANRFRGPVGFNSISSGPFPNIRTKKPADIYISAMKAHASYLKVIEFRKTYQKIISAFPDTSLSLGSTGKLQIKMTSPKSLRKLISDDLIRKTTDEISKKLLDELKLKMMSTKDLTRYNKFVAVLGQLVLLHSIHKDIDNRDLVNKQKGSRRKEADKLKATFLLKILAIKLVGNATSSKVQQVHVALWKQYHDYEQKYFAYTEWQTMEEKLAGTYKSHPMFKIPGT